MSFEKDSEKNVHQAQHDLNLPDSDARKVKAFWTLGKAFYFKWGGLDRNIPLALSFYKKAADQGHAGACLELTNLYYWGSRYVDKDREKARHYAYLPCPNETKFNGNGHYQDIEIGKREYFQKLLPSKSKL